MVEVYNKALNKSIFVERIIGKVVGKHEGPTIVFFAGIHGNETAGVFALKQVFSEINSEHMSGSIYGISGNLKALKNHKRYIDEDLNRIWLDANLKALEKKTNLSIEENEQVELFRLLRGILNNNNKPSYFIDLHTTSSKTLPFITINDALINRKFSSLFPVPIVLGIEEYLEGPLLSYINKLGYVSLGFESGQHDELSAVNNAVSFIFLSLVFSNCISKSDVPYYDTYYDKLRIEASHNAHIFEVIYLHKIKETETFKMQPNFKSFQSINKGKLLAISNNKKIISAYNAKIFMPLYQAQGKEGFFIIKKIHPFFLWLSAVLRQIRIDGLLVLFPGISWKNREEGVLRVNLKVAKFMAKPIFHLLGYRNKQFNHSSIYLFNRERTSKKKMYKSQSWYKPKPLI